MWLVDRKLMICTVIDSFTDTIFKIVGFCGFLQGVIWDYFEFLFFYRFIYFIFFFGIASGDCI